MVLKTAKGRTLYRIMSFCCAVVSLFAPESHLEVSIGLTAAQSFCNYGYDAGILGGVQTTEPFLDAIGVRLCLFSDPLSHFRTTPATLLTSLAHHSYSTQQEPT